MITEAYLSLWLETYIQPKRARNTVRAYQFALAHLTPATKETEISQLGPLQLQREINALAAAYPRQAQLMYQALRMAMKKAVTLRFLDHSPMEAVETPPHDAREAEVMDADEAARYIEAAREIRHGKLLILMLCLGLRRNEARALRPCDLDPSGLLHIRFQRTEDLAPLKSRSSRRDIPVPEALRALFEGEDEEFLDDTSESSLRRAHRAAQKAAGIEKHITLHGLRHTCATLANENGIQGVVIQRLLGHRHYSTTADFYIHPDNRLLTSCTAILYNQIGRYGARLEIV